MESVRPGWQELKTLSGPKCPKLFYNFTADEDGYTTQFTDLIGFWSAVSPAVDIVDYAKITKASIDPSDSKSQLRVLLQKLSQSLAEGENTLRQEDDETGAILLQTVLKLPRPLQPLKWEFYLEARGTEELAENVLRPCLLEASESKNKIDFLCDVIKSKDHIISKLLDKIEGTTIDLSTIFPGITGAKSRKGQTTIKAAQKQVPHLKLFSKDDWLQQAKSDGPYANFEMVGLSKLVSGCEQCPKHKSKQHEQWLSKLPKATSSASQALKDKVEDDSSDHNETESDSDDFETQKKKKGKLDSPGGGKNDRTGDPSEGGLIKRVSADESNTSEQGMSKKSERAKTASPLRTSSPLPSLPPPLSLSQNQHQRKSSTTTATSDGLDLDTINSTTKSRLGKLGAKSKIPVKARPLDPQTSSSPAPLRNPSPSPQLPSSPPLLPEPLRPDSRRRSSSSIVTLSSLDPATPQKRKLGRLESFKSKSVSVTPEHKRFQDDKASDRESSKIPSTQTSPSRRLGRIGRTASYLSRQQTFSSPIPEQLGEQGQNEEDKAEDSDASTASTTSSVSPEPAGPSTIDQALNDNASIQPVGDAAKAMSQLPSSVPLETQKPVSKEEKAAQRREELKRKIGDTGASSTIGNTGLRKKRKF